MYVFAQRLKELRTNAKMTQKRLANKLNVTETTISKYECEQAYPSFEGMRSISTIFNVSMDYLYGVEKPSDVSAFGLTAVQRETLSELAELFRSQNLSSNKGLSDEQYKIIGKIVDIFRG